MKKREKRNQSVSETKQKSETEELNKGYVPDFTAQSEIIVFDSLILAPVAGLALRFDSKVDEPKKTF